MRALIKLLITLFSILILSGCNNTVGPDDKVTVDEIKAAYTDFLPLSEGDTLTFEKTISGDFDSGWATWDIQGDDYWIVEDVTYSQDYLVKEIQLQILSYTSTDHVFYVNYEDPPIRESTQDTNSGIGVFKLFFEMDSVVFDFPDFLTDKGNYGAFGVGRGPLSTIDANFKYDFSIGNTSSLSIWEYRGLVQYGFNYIVGKSKFYIIGISSSHGGSWNMHIKNYNTEEPAN